MFAYFKTMRSRTWLILLALVVGAVTCLWFLRDFRNIPLAEVSSTIPQRNLHEIDAGFFPQADGSRVFADTHGPDLERIRATLRGKEQDIFLVRGNDLAAAMKGAARRFVDSVPADGAIDPKDGNLHNEFWLVFYLGSAGSSPPKWQLQSVWINGNSICVRYREPWHGGETRDIHQYLGWAPLGRLAPGKYSLALVNTSQWQTVCERLVEVE